MSLQVRLICLALGAISILTPWRAQAQIEGNYVGIYEFSGQSFMGAELVLEKTRKGFEGVITFSHFEHSVGSAVVRSSFAMRTTYDTNIKTLRFVFVDWIDAPGFGDFDLGPRQGRLETNGQVLSGDGFEFALEGSPEAERMMLTQRVFETHALTQRKADDDYKKRSDRYERELADEIAKGPPPGPDIVGRRGRH
jgi:hypothetical protein